MKQSSRYLRASAAARRLSVSIKALRLYEQAGLIAPARTAAGWRVYGPEEMIRAADIVGLRRVGLSLAEIKSVFGTDAVGRERALAIHQAGLERRIRDMAAAVEKVRRLRAGLLRENATSVEIAGTGTPRATAAVSLSLPWPWDGERFDLGGISPLTYIIGPLGSGKTRFALKLAAALPGGAFLGLDRIAGDGAAAKTRLASDPDLQRRVQQTLERLGRDGASASPALLALIVALEAETPAYLVIDMVEQGLDQVTQEVVIAHLKRRAPGSRPLFLLTRSSSILDLNGAGPDEAIILCPANHSPPIYVCPCPGAPGYEAVATCLAPPHVRARTEGVIAWRP
ncbi:MAG TPA: MerR family transcriptional regulator [Hyphomicrobium sp.]|nr:MerR family transcriptional regulator [Hyphomicrobium sp.]